MTLMKTGDEMRQDYVDGLKHRMEEAQGEDREKKPRRWTFRKVYSGVGYPTLPQNDKARAIDGYVNAFAPKQGKRTYDARPLKKWLNKSLN